MLKKLANAAINTVTIAAIAAGVIAGGVAAQTIGTFTDTRDNQTYRTVTIGNQTWMAENLNYRTKDSWCYDNADSNCVKYGRLYTWDAAMKACPAGWRLPGEAEWDSLMTVVGGTFVSEEKEDIRYWKNAGTKLKSKSGWSTDEYCYISGTDNFGFSAMPGGDRWNDDTFYDISYYGYWWSATEYGGGFAWMWSMNCNSDRVYSTRYSTPYAFSVRCVRD